MAKYLQIQIPKGCEENWDTMQQQANGKFCNSCQKNVVDFTRMTNEQLVQFFKNRKDLVCGRLTSDQLNTGIPIPAKRIPWLKYFFQITIPAFLFSSKVIAQGNLKVQQHSHASHVGAKQGGKLSSSKTTKAVSAIKFDESPFEEKILIKSHENKIDTEKFPSVGLGNRACDDPRRRYFQHGVQADR